MNSFMKNFFGALGRGNFGVNVGASFIPGGKKGEHIEIKGDQAFWLGLKNRMMQKYAYENCFALASVIDRLAEYDLNGVVRINRKGGKGKNNPLTGTYADEVMKLLMNPNPMQSWYQFRGQQMVNKRVHGFSIVLPLKSKYFDVPIQMVNIPSWAVDVVPSDNNDVHKTKVEDFIKEYRVTLLGSSFTLKPSEVIVLEDGFWQSESDNLLLPQSRLVGLDMAVSNLMFSMEADNVLLRKKGPLGFISHDAAASKDSVAGYVPMKPKERDEVQQALQAYGMSWEQYLYVISRVPMKWNPMSFDVKALGTKETVVKSEKAICVRYGYPYPLYDESESTYANDVNNALVACYQNNTIPSALRDIAKYAIYFKADANNAVFDVDFGEVACLQENQIDAAEAQEKLMVSLEKKWDLDLITRNQMLEALGLEKIADGDKRKSEMSERPAMAVTLGVGGTQAMMEVLTSTLPPAAKQKALELLFGLSPADAKALSEQPEVKEENTNLDKEDENNPASKNKGTETEG
jgi:hypothetical protein